MFDAGRGLSALLLGMLVLASGCLTHLGSGGPPEDPAALDYHVEADGPHAPHTVTYEGALDRFDATDIDATLSPQSLRVTPNPNVVAAPEPGEGPGGTETSPEDRGPAALHLRTANATLELDDGSTQTLDDTHLEVTAEDGFPVEGIDRVTTEALRVHEGAYHVPPQAPLHEMDVHHPDPPEEEMAASFYQGALHVEGAATLEDVTVREADASPQPDGGDPVGTGTLTLHEGRYLFKTSGLAMTLDQPLELDGEDRARLSLDRPRAPVHLYEQTHQPRRVELVVDAFEATLDAANSHVEVTADAVQWIEDERPWFHASLEAGFEDADGAAKRASFALEPGENATAWIELSETSNVATAPSIHPKLDTGAVEATFGQDWFDSPDPDLGDAIGSAIKNLVAGIFVDFSVTTLEPGQDRYIPLILHVPEDQPPGTYHTEAYFVGDNAKTDRLNATVTVG